MHRPWVLPVSSAYGYSRYLERLNGENNSGFLICRIEDGAMVGVVNFNEITLGCLCTAFVGYWGVEGFGGCGYLTEGVAWGIDYAFASLGLNRVEACIQPQNLKSFALVERLKMDYEGIARKYLKIGGEWKDHQRWSMLKEDWLARGGSLQFVGGESA